MDCDEITEFDCTNCNTVGTHRINDISNSGSCPCDTGYTDDGNEICSPICHHSWLFIYKKIKFNKIFKKLNFNKVWIAMK